MEFISEELSKYAEDHTTPESDLLAQLNRETYSQVLIPRMLSGHLQGRILSLISKIKQPRNVLEIGTYTGYSALCLAEGLTENGELDTIEKNEELETRILKYFKQSPYASQLNLHIGDAIELVASLDKKFDLVFIDADKSNYLNYYNLVFDKLNTGALIIADNVLWSGKVLNESQIAKDIDTKALVEFNSFVQQDSRVENVLMPVRDGLMIIRKK